MWSKLKSDLKKLTWQDFKKSLTVLNILQAIWMFLVVVSGAILVLVMFNLAYIADPITRDLWLEVNIQILNGCFTVMALITQPFRAVLAYWTGRYYYSKNDAQKGYYAAKIGKMWAGISLCPTVSKLDSSNTDIAVVEDGEKRRELNESGDTRIESSVEPILVNEKEDFVPFWKWALIVFMLNGQCVFQYPITAVHWIWFNKSQERPGWVIGLFLPLSFLCMAASGIWIYFLTKKKAPATEKEVKSETLPVIVSV